MATTPTPITARVARGAAAADEELNKRMAKADVVFSILSGLNDEFDSVDTTTREGRRVKLGIVEIFEDIASRLGADDVTAIEFTTAPSPGPKPADPAPSDRTKKTDEPAKTPEPTKGRVKGWFANLNQ